MKSSRSRWVSGIGAVLVGGLLVTSMAAADDDKDKKPFDPKNPLKQIFVLLQQVLTKLDSIGGGEGNHTLRWDTNNPSASRFTTAFTGAVLDKNTGLVWEQVPDATPRNRAASVLYCAGKAVGGTVGWRLPSIIELKSVQDPSLPVPFVPASVFPGFHHDHFYWSATMSVDRPPLTWDLDFGLDGHVGFDGPDFLDYAWCVRGGMNADQY